MVVSPEIRKRMEQMERECASKGISVVNDLEPSQQEPTNFHTKPRDEHKEPFTLDELIPDVEPEAEPEPLLSVVSSPTPTTPSIIPASTSMSKFKAFYHHLLDSGLYIAPCYELEFGFVKDTPMDEAGIERLVIPDEAYNANLTFTILTSLLQNTSMLYFGPPGSGKTTTSEFVLSGIYDLPLSVIHEATIYGHPELTEEKMLAFVDIVSYLKNHEEVIGIREFMKTPARIIDEINRIPPGKQSILYQILDRGWTVYNNMKIVANPGPLFGTANDQDSGNYEFPPAFVDRFDIALVVGRLNSYYINQFQETRNNKIKFVKDSKITPPQRIEGSDIVNARKEIYFNTHIDDNLANKIAHFIAELESCDKASMSPEKKTKSNAHYRKPGELSKDCRYIGKDDNICYSTQNSVSARTMSSVYAYSKALAWWRGNNQVTEEDVKHAISYSSWFKLVPTRAIVEKEDGFINDRQAMVNFLWDTASRTYGEVVSAFPGYKDMVRTVTDFYVKGIKPDKSELDDMMGNLKNIDSTAKFSLGATVKRMYMDYDRI